MRPLLMAVTDTARARHSVAEVAAAVARGGADLVQVREPLLTDRELVEVVRRAVAAVAGTPARVLVNERFDVALAAGAHGVHLKDRGLPPGEVRAAALAVPGAPPDFLVGVSAHDASALARACGPGAADHATVGPWGPSPGKQPLGPDGFCALLAEARAMAGGRLTKPWLALGGAGEADAPMLASLALPGETWGLAAIRPFLGPDPENATRRLRAALDAAEGSAQRDGEARSTIRT